MKIQLNKIVVLGHDMLSLLFHFLDEFLFVFSAEPFFIARVSVVQNLETWSESYYIW